MIAKILRHIPPVATVLEPGERAEVDRAGAGLYRTIHRESVAEVLRDLRVRRVSAVLLSASRCPRTDLSRTMRVVREFPRIPTVVLVSRHGHPSPSELLALGNCGMRQLVDVRAPDGWGRLREAIVGSVTRDRDERAMAELMKDLEGVSNDMVKFMEALFAGYTGTRTVRDLAGMLGVVSSTLVSRFYRAGLPAPKRYLAWSGLVRAARLLENPGLSIADVANHLNHSSAQSFARHVRTYLGLSAGEFRQAFDGEKMMRRFREDLVLPYKQRLQALSPLLMRNRSIRVRVPSTVASSTEQAREARTSSKA